jgi:hypothetical protein
MFFARIRGTRSSETARSNLGLWNSAPPARLCRGCRLRSNIGFVHRDVEAGLPELLLHIDASGSLKRQHPGAHPSQFSAAHAMLHDVHRSAGQVGAHHVTLGGCGIPVGKQQLFLVLDCPDRGADLDRMAEARCVSASQVTEKVSRPGPAIAVTLRQIAIHYQRRGRRDRHQQLLRNAVGEVVLIQNTFQSLRIGHLVLVGKRCGRSNHRRDSCNGPVLAQCNRFRHWSPARRETSVRGPAP